jgi:raffinose/stachyose/melibiose transport system permease protein
MSIKRNRLLAWTAMYAVLVVLASLWIYPLVIAVVKSFAVGGLANYEAVLNHERFNYWTAIGNSFLIAGASTLGIVVLSTLGGFAFSQMRFRGRVVLYRLLLAGLAIPVASVITPLFFSINTVGLRDSQIGVILPIVAFNVLTMLLLMKNHFDGIPPELLEAATIDGARPFRVLLSIFLPISGPVLANVSVLSFVYSWNEYLLPNLLLSDDRKFPVTVAVGLLQYQKMSQEQIGQLYAGLILLTIPSVLVYLFSQRYLQAGLTAGAVK